MLVALNPRCICDAWTRIQFVRRPSTLIPLVNFSHPLPQSRFFHAGWTSSVAREESLTRQETNSTTPLAEPEKDKTSSLKRAYKTWSKEEIDRFDYLYSDGKNPTVRSILSFFPGRKRYSLYQRIYTHKDSTSRQNWSLEDTAKLLELHSAGTPMVDMLKCFPGRTVNAVLGRLRRSLPGSYFIDRRRVVNPSILKLEQNGGNTSQDQEGGAIVTAVQLRKPIHYWNDEEDAALRNLVQITKKRNPDRWTHELSRILSDPDESTGLATVRSLDSCLRRWRRLETWPFVARTAWTKEEDDLLRKSVYSRLEIPLNPTSDEQHTTPLKIENGLFQSKPSAGTLENKEEQAQWPEVGKEKLKSLDWYRVALDVGTRDRDSCRMRFDSHFKLTQNKKWTKKENELFMKGLRQHGRDWAKVASVVGTRNALQVRKKYNNLQQRILRTGSQIS